MSNIERVAFNEDLNRHMTAVSNTDERADRVERMVDDMMAGEYNPFTSENTNEAIREMGFADQAFLAAYLKMIDTKPLQIETHSQLAEFLVDRVHDYWHAAAIKKAQADYDKAGF